MASTIIDSRIFQGIFSSDAMRAVWSDENRTSKYIDIERALAKVQGENDTRDALLRGESLASVFQRMGIL